MTNIEPLRRPPTHADRERRAAIAEHALGVDSFAPLDWLAETGVTRPETLTAWADGKLIPVQAGAAFDVVLMPTTPGWGAIGHLRAFGADVGPVLHTVRGVLVLVATGTAAGWDLPGSTVLDAGEVVAFPHPSIVAPYTRNGASWVQAPRDGEPLTSASDLYGAYAAALVSIGRGVLEGAS